MLWLCAIAGIIAATMWVRLVNSHDAAIQKSSDQYEKCVIAEYGISPAGYYSEHGEYPYCDNNQK